jgi:endonuclease-3
MTKPKPGVRQRRRAERLIAAIDAEVGLTPLPSVSQIAREKRDPFRILVSTIISLRTKDEVTEQASRRLFELADTPAALGRLDVGKVERAIYPAGFYKTKARTLKDISRRLVHEYNGRVPDTIDELLTFKGVGRKTATLVVSLGYGIPAICVDTHVHRITNRWGFVNTRNPHETELALEKKLPKKFWISINELLVLYGQRICKPISPYCSLCPVEGSCPRIGVGRSR